MTESEALFERFCRRASLAFDRIGECEDKRPDYRINHSEGNIIVEVKQIDPSPDVRALLARPLEEWTCDHAYHWGMPGERVRAKIKSSVPQLRALSMGTLPTLLVLYDAIKQWPELLQLTGDARDGQ